MHLKTLKGALELEKINDILKLYLMGGAPLSPQRPGPTQNFETITTKLHEILYMHRRIITQHY